MVVTGSVLLAGEARTLLGAHDPDAVAVDSTRRGVEAVAEDTESELFGGRLDDLLPQDDHDLDDSDLLDDVRQHVSTEDADSEWERSMRGVDDDA